MSSQELRTPDELRQESELICEKLLSWVRVDSVRGVRWRRASDSKLNFEVLQTPSFTTWAEAGLILDAMIDREPVLWKHHEGWQAHFDQPWDWSIQPTGPLAIRAAALEYIKRTEYDAAAHQARYP